ncbi:hypothetical protein MGWOODY_Mmi90 [hydrothermal vent metagenome]|uniref:Uncharacterized protein n=1 Tax=hydrothermal vent metagenome TaxID=652676 RepID=A0A160VG74_9ZZZZ
MGVSEGDGNRTSIGTPLWVCFPEKEKMKATNNKDITAIAVLIKPVRCAFPRDFLRGVENNLADLRRFNLATSAYDIGESMV